jgi:hypothetical protein
MGIKTKLLCAALALTFIVAAPAYAQQINPTQEAYSVTAAKVQEQVTTAGTTESDEALPFTGLELTIVLGMGIALLAAGLGIRRLSRSQT